MEFYFRWKKRSDHLLNDLRLMKNQCIKRTAESKGLMNWTKFNPENILYLWRMYLLYCLLNVKTTTRLSYIFKIIHDAAVVKWKKSTVFPVCSQFDVLPFYVLITNLLKISFDFLRSNPKRLIYSRKSFGNSKYYIKYDQNCLWFLIRQHKCPALNFFKIFLRLKSEEFRSCPENRFGFLGLLRSNSRRKSNLRNPKKSQ